MPGPSDFLFEIGVEELPPKSLRGLETALRDEFRRGLEEAGLEHVGLESFASPRRLAVMVRKLASRQPAQLIEKRGPPLAAARDGNGQWTRAAKGFADSFGCAPEDLQTLRTEKGAWLMFSGRRAGKAAAALLPEIASGALKRLPVARAMRWGSGPEEFIRPVHWIVMLHGKRVVPATILGRRSGRRTAGHRFLGQTRLSLESADQYAGALRRLGKVIASFQKRRDSIVRLASRKAEELGGELVGSPALVDEITGLVEWPVALAGVFEQRYLELPEAVIIASLQEHQRFFPVRGKSGALLPGFVLISNLESRDPRAVSGGAERVVRARLADAAFFYQRDRSEPLGDLVNGLADVRYQKGLGSLGDRAERLASLTEGLAAATGADPALAGRAALLCKADLLTGMVGEFPGLQGFMGADYARHGGEADQVSAAIGEHYAPRHAGGRIPASPAGKALALADRLDALAGLFALGRRPRGASDPFGLRRASLAVLRICIEGEVEIDLPASIAKALARQPLDIPNPGEVGQTLYEFMMDRLRAWYLDGLHPEAESITVSPELFSAVRARAPASPLDFHHRLIALHGFLAGPAATDLAEANKRIANILRSAVPTGVELIDPELLLEPEEQTLQARYLLLLPQYRQRVDDLDYAGALELLASLQGPLATFFEKVLVMSEDATLRANRLALLAGIRETLLKVADLSLLPGRK